MESTYTQDGFRGMDERYNFDPGRTGYMGEVLSADSFLESPSAGGRAAFQSHSPTVSTNFGQSSFPLGFSSVINENTWLETPEDSHGDFWVQKYSHSPLTGRKTGFDWPSPTGTWFDSNVDQTDGYGRNMMPYPGTGEYLSYFANWSERAVNTTVACQAIGCQASSYLQVYDPAREEATACKMSFGVHATDFDDEDEVVKELKVNGRLVTSSCQITSGTCNSSAALWPCVSETPVGTLLEDGRLLVQASISEFVDECPYNGNLLSGVAVVTCMVRNLPPSTTVASQATPATTSSKATGATFTASGDLRCDKPGCSASLTLLVDPLPAELGGTCLMTMTVVPTDFDDGLGAAEEIESVLVDGTVVAAGVSPGINPCTAYGTWGADLAALQQARMNYTVLSQYDITDKVLANTMLVVKASISKHVDDCPYNGSFLYAAVHINCTYKPSS